MLTADTITDKQIVELRRVASGYTTNISDRDTVWWCDIALGLAEVKACANTNPLHNCVNQQRQTARARCAEILNARTVTP
mgnify:CR=1 FL=1